MEKQACKGLSSLIGADSIPVERQEYHQIMFFRSTDLREPKNIPLPVALEVAVKVKRLFSKSAGGSFCTHLSVSAAGVPDGYIALLNHIPLGRLLP